ncbi:helix-turn-helix domain-containing protein [Maribacter sp. 2-571]|uniref:helix-turn-helix domain-containing protein n=1 Tax=Maribacter sp. 2-571 TaxID=3417569 RepID=UPI003D330BA9
MIKIVVDADSTAGTVKQIQGVIGGTIIERWGEHILTVDNGNAKGTIRFITFDWGVNLLDYDITFMDDVVLQMDASEYNPIHFAYCLEGYCKHRFGNQPESAARTLEQFQSVIITSRDGGYNFGYFPKLEKLAINVIQIGRKKFLNKRLNNVDELNRKLYEVFLDTDHEKAYSFYGTYDLKLADKIGALRKVRAKGMIRVMQIEGLVYEILAMHILDHDKVVSNKKPKTSLLNRELQMVRQVAKKIVKDVSQEYSLDALSVASGLSQAKLQEGFKALYARTVTEYIRHVRLEQARDYMNTTDMNISEIVYSIGFSSRSYFSKIFKRKFGISPSEYQENVRLPEAV